ncbi:SET domain-protein [Cladorrhinum sp. PSN332]|nr:SET domain-protein [Cladorrhinum sp. PSN332]
MAAEKYANFRNEETFPPFSKLPEEYDINLSFYEISSSNVYKPRRHWCFLAEICDVEGFIRLRLIVRDKRGATAPVAFYTDDKGAEFTHQAQSGFTVAILYANQHGFLDMTVGVRLEESSIFKIIPAPLNEVLALSDRVGRYSAGRAGWITCHGCDEEKSCQTNGWNNKGHKRDCKLIRDNGLRAMFAMNWDRFEGFVEFPLAEPTTASGSTVKTTTTLAGSMNTATSNMGGGPSTSSDDFKMDRVCDIQPIPCKGKGMIATAKITKGTRILSELPIFKVPRDNPDISAVDDIVTSEVSRLNAAQRREFFDLANIYGDIHSLAMGIARTNVLPLGSNARSGGLFLVASRINHSCRHNAQNTWNENIGRLTIHALRDIEPGEEITICYLPRTGPYEERQRTLSTTFKFTCACDLCSLPPAQRRQSDAQLSSILDLDMQISTVLWDDNVKEKQALQLVRSVLDLSREEGIWGASIGRAYYDAYQIAVHFTDEPRAKVYAQRTWEARCVAEGEDSPTAVKMKRAVEERRHVEVPEMDEIRLEEWLWRGTDN